MPFGILRTGWFNLQAPWRKSVVIPYTLQQPNNGFAHIPWKDTPDFPFHPTKKEIPKQKLLVKGPFKVSSRGTVCG